MSCKQLRQQTFSTFPGTKELAPIHVELKLCKANASFLDETLKKSQMEVADLKIFVKEQKGWQDTASVRTVEFSGRRPKATASTAMYPKECLQVQKKMATALKTTKP